MPVKAIATVIQNNTSGFASRKSEDIETVKDFEGKVYGGWGSPSEEAVLNAIMTNGGADYSKLTITNVSTDDFFAATEKDIDLVWIFEGWTGIEAKLKGVELNYLPVKDLDPALNYYTPILIAGNELINNDPDKVKNFLKATLKVINMLSIILRKRERYCSNMLPSLTGKWCLRARNSWPVNMLRMLLTGV